MIRGGLVRLCVRDVGRSVRFYVETLGMKLVEEGGAAWAVIDAGEGFRIGLYARGAGESGTSGTGASGVALFPKVPLAEAIAILENRGIVFDRRDEGAVMLARFEDPDGNALYLREER